MNKYVKVEWLKDDEYSDYSKFSKSKEINKLYM